MEERFAPKKHNAPHKEHIFAAVYCACLSFKLRSAAGAVSLSDRMLAWCMQLFSEHSWSSHVLCMDIADSNMRAPDAPSMRPSMQPHTYALINVHTSTHMHTVCMPQGQKVVVDEENGPLLATMAANVFSALSTLNHFNLAEQRVRPPMS